MSRKVVSVRLYRIGPVLPIIVVAVVAFLGGFSSGKSGHGGDTAILDPITAPPSPVDAVPQLEAIAQPSMAAEVLPHQAALSVPAVPADLAPGEQAVGAPPLPPDGASEEEGVPAPVVPPDLLAAIPPPPMPADFIPDPGDLPSGVTKLGECLLPPNAEELVLEEAAARGQRVFDTEAERVYVRADGSCVHLLKCNECGPPLPDFAPDTIVSAVPAGWEGGSE